MTWKEISFNKDEILMETKNWISVLGFKQVYLGYNVIFLKRECNNFTELTSEEILDLQYVINKLYLALSKSFNCCHLNITCLMNEGCQEGKDMIMHWHFRPRYNKPVFFFNNILFQDNEWGNHYSSKKEKIGGSIDFTPEFRKKLVNIVRDNLV